MAFYLCQQCQLPPSGVRLLGMMMDTSPEMIIAILAILKLNCAYVPLNPELPAERTRYILENCSIKNVITLHRLQDKIPDLPQVRHCCIDAPGNCPDLPATPPQGIPPENPGNPAYVMFTSGSTGTPKGVPITHANLLPLLRWGYRVVGLNPHHRVIYNLSAYFDWSVWAIFITLTSGASLHMAPGEIRLAPETLAGFMAKLAVTVLHVTPTQYKYLARAEQRLDTLKYLFFGGEELPLDTARRCLQLVNPACRVFNKYGLTECTIISTALELSRQNLREFCHLTAVPLGRPLDNTRILVLDKYLNLCPPGITGELYIAGDGIAYGYLNDPEKSYDTFIHNPYAAAGLRETRLYKTGDLGRWLTTGNLEYLGRSDHQVKIRGLRIELGEITHWLLRHPLVKEAVVLAKESEPGEKKLVAYFIPAKELSIIEIRQYLMNYLPDYMIPAHFMAIPKIPVTPNGKIDTRALPGPAANSGETPGKLENATQRLLAAIWSEALNVDPETLGLDSNFFHLGGHSLSAVVVIARINRALQIKLPLGQLFKTPTLRGLSQGLTAAGETPLVPLVPVEKKEYYDVSHAQQQVWVLSQLEEASVSFNIPIAVWLEGKLQVPLIRQTFERLIRHHESLRTVFITVDGQLKQQVLPPAKVGFDVEYRNLEALHDNESEARNLVERQIAVPFDLSASPLFKVILLQVAGEKHVFFFNMHHIISDFLSHDILVEQVLTLYNHLEKGTSTPLNPLSVQYKDYAAWHLRQLKGEQFRQHRDYWLNQLKGNLPRLELPPDRQRPALQTYQGDAVDLKVDEALFKTLKTFSQTHQVTLFMTLFSVLNLLFYYYTGQQDLVIGTVSGGRAHDALQEQVGYYLNTLVLRTRFHEQETFTAVLNRVKTVLSEAYQHQAYPFDLLVEALDEHRDLSRHPFFDIMVDMLNYHRYNRDTPDTGRQGELQVRDFEIQGGGAKFDLTIYLIEERHTMAMVFEYNRDLFERSSICRLADRLVKLLETVLADPGLTLASLRLEKKPRIPLIQPLSRNQ